jgi:hypothetical protein
MCRILTLTAPATIKRTFGTTRLGSSGAAGLDDVRIGDDWLPLERVLR